MRLIWKSRHPPANIHRQEFLIYGWFAYERHRDEYRFTRSDEDRTRLMVGQVNQIPPDYCHLGLGSMTKTIRISANFERSCSHCGQYLQRLLTEKL